MGDSEVLLKSGLMKHPQWMSCIYATLFLITMLLIIRQVRQSSPPALHAQVLSPAKATF